MAVEVRRSYGAALLVCFLVVFAFGIPGQQMEVVNVNECGEGGPAR